MIHRGPFQPLPFCDSVTAQLRSSGRVRLFVATTLELSYWLSKGQGKGRCLCLHADYMLP